jgi:hypothetical protein
MTAYKCYITLSGNGGRQYQYATDCRQRTVPLAEEATAELLLDSH